MHTSVDEIPMVSGFLAWAEKRQYFTAKAARPDVYRAANSILRLAVEGRLCMAMKPPNYTADRGNLVYIFLKHA
jgi:hypothetical protein